MCIYAAEEVKNYIEMLFTHQLVYYFEHQELEISMANAEEEKNPDQQKVNEDR